MPLHSPQIKTGQVDLWQLLQLLYLPIRKVTRQTWNKLFWHWVCICMTLLFVSSR